MIDSLQWNIDTIAHVIDISVAPVFLLAGISGFLMVLTNRLGRAIDRSRSLKTAVWAEMLPEHQQTIDFELSGLLMRGRFINAAINLATLSALLVCLVIITLFLGSLFSINVSIAVATLFIVCMSILIAALSCFLVEVFVATRTFRITLNSTDSFRKL
jgi:hypothetical protein